MPEGVSQVCTKCGVEKELSFFHRRENGYRKDCKMCVAIKTKRYRENNMELIKEKKKAYWKENGHKHSEKRKEYYLSYKKNNHDKLKAVKKKSAQKYRAKQLEYHRKRYASDPEYNLRVKIRRRIGGALKRINGGRRDRVIDLLGCTYSEFKIHFESLMTKWMEWEMVFNGKIHIDHKVPCSKFNLLDPAQQAICFHYTNLQPLWAEDNMEKHDKFESEWTKQKS